MPITAREIELLKITVKHQKTKILRLEKEVDVWVKTAVDYSEELYKARQRLLERAS